MARQVDQNIDLIVPDRLGGVVVIHPANVAPVVGVLLEDFGDVVPASLAGIAENLDR